MVGVLQRSMMKMLKMMKTNVLLEMRHLLSMGLPVYSRPPQRWRDYRPRSRKSFWGVFRMFVMGVIDDRDGLT